MKYLSILFIALSLLIVSAPASAQERFDMQHFAALPVQHDGRIKPLSSFANLALKQFSGQSSVQQKTATEWIALILFDPQNAAELPVFAVPDKTLINKLSLDETQDLYNYAQLQPALRALRDEALPLFSKEEDTLTTQEKNLLSLYENTALFTALMRSLTALLPLDITLPPAYQKEIDGPLNFTQLAKFEQQLEKDLTTIITQKGRDPSQYSEDELAIAKASFHLQTLRAGGQGNDILRIIPVQWKASTEEWAAPWTIMLQGQGAPATAFLLSQWIDLASAYRQGDHDRWRAVAKDILEETRLQSPDSLSLTRLKTEQLYRALHPYIWVITLYLLSFFAAAFLTLKGEKLSSPILRYAPITLALTGIVAHAIAIIARSYILERPPVGTLYESVLFVTLICAIFGALISRTRSAPIALMVGTASAAALLLCAPIFQPSGGDSLEVLAAVLNTNFWLTTHVLVITAGYGVCILAALLAHAGLYIQGFKPDKDLWQTLQKLVYRTSIAALLLTAIGTALGGIWADQSWGRFWGWDPKENGALLIVLWLIWLLHGRISAKLGPAAFMALSSALNIIVALSWFGVNLLNVGLHSYGFTSGLASGLLAFCTAEILLITALYFAAQKQIKKQEGAA